MNTRENFWNVYCFATNQMRDETATDNRQTAAWSSHDSTRNNELTVSSSSNLHVYRYQMLNVFFSILAFVSENSRYERYFTEKQYWVEQTGSDTDSASEGKENEPTTSDVEQRLFHVQFKRSYWWAVIGDFRSIFYCS